MWKNPYPSTGWLAALITVSYLVTVPAGYAQQQEQPESGELPALELIKEGYSKYFELQQLLSKEQSDWQLEREILKDRTQMIIDQITDLTEKTAEEESKITAADTERVELNEQLDGLIAIEKEQLVQVQKAERAVKELLPALPEPLRNKVDPLASRLPKDNTKEEDIKLSVSQRFGNILGILNEVNKFHADITLVNERREVGDGRQAEVETIYLGISKGFYAGSGDTAEVAGIGTPAAQDFVWEKSEKMAAAIGKTIRIYQNTEIAEYVPLPVTVQDIDSAETTTE